MAYRGKSLKALRESKKIGLRRISNETRISMAYLEDLEDERFDRFPGKFYFNSFAKEYARALELDPAEVVADLQCSYDEWSGDQLESPLKRSTPTVDDGILQRIAGYFRGVQEV